MSQLQAFTYFYDSTLDYLWIILYKSLRSLECITVHLTSISQDRGRYTWKRRGGVLGASIYARGWWTNCISSTRRFEEPRACRTHMVDPCMILMHCNVVVKYWKFPSKQFSTPFLNTEAVELLIALADAWQQNCATSFVNILPASHLQWYDLTLTHAAYM